jgi:hypothetical protein
MAQPYLTDLNVQCWEHPGKLGLATPTVCLLHANVELGRAILGALDELSGDSPSSAKRTLTFQPSSRKKSISKMRLLFVPSRHELRVLHIACDPGEVTIEMTEVGLEVLRKGVAAWCNGSEDFGVSARHSDLKKRELGALDKSSGELWFWGPTMEP